VFNEQFQTCRDNGKKPYHADTEHCSTAKFKRFAEQMMIPCKSLLVTQQAPKIIAARPIENSALSVKTVAQALAELTR
jgi:hypothetical protein